MKYIAYIRLELEAPEDPPLTLPQAEILASNVVFHSKEQFAGVREARIERVFNSKFETLEKELNSHEIVVLEAEKG